MAKSNGDGLSGELEADAAVVTALSGDLTFLSCLGDLSGWGRGEFDVRSMFCFTALSNNGFVWDEGLLDGSTGPLAVSLTGSHSACGATRGHVPANQ